MTNVNINHILNDEHLKKGANSYFTDVYKIKIVPRKHVFPSATPQPSVRAGSSPRFWTLRKEYFLVQVRLTWASMDQLWLRLASKIKFINQGALLVIDKNEKWAGKLIIM